MFSWDTSGVLAGDSIHSTSVVLGRILTSFSPLGTRLKGFLMHIYTGWEYVSTLLKVDF